MYEYHKHKRHHTFEIVIVTYCENLWWIFQPKNTCALVVFAHIDYRKISNSCHIITKRCHKYMRKEEFTLMNVLFKKNKWMCFEFRKKGFVVKNVNRTQYVMHHRYHIYCVFICNCHCLWYISSIFFFVSTRPLTQSLYFYSFHSLSTV